MADDRPVIMPGGVLPDPEFRIERREEPAHAELLWRLDEKARLTDFEIAAWTFDEQREAHRLLREARAAIAQMAQQRDIELERATEYRERWQRAEARLREAEARARHLEDRFRAD